MPLKDEPASDRQVFMHVEIVHDDPDAVADFLGRTLGGRRVETAMAAQVEQIAPGLRVVHVRVSGVVFQVIRPVPIPGMNSWWEQLQEHGPSVHNVTFMVDDPEKTVAAATAAGAVELATFDMSVDAVGLGITGARTTSLVDAVRQLGTRLELIEYIPEWVPGETP